MKLSIITLNFKKSELTLRCLSSLNKQFQKMLQNNEMEVIVVDNKSPDDSVKILQEAIKKNTYKNITLYPNQENAGFGSGNDFGAQKAKGEYLLFLNNDTEVRDTGLWNMVNYMEQHKEVSILGGQLRNFDGSLQSSTGKFYTPFNVLLLLFGMQRYGGLDKSPTTISEVDWVKGAILLIRKDVYKALGGFDPKIFMYTEDMELCYRAKQAGYKVYFYPDINVFHADQGSSNRTFAIVNIYKNLLYFYKKHRTTQEYTFVKSLLWSKAMSLVIIGRITHNTYLLETYEKALAVLR
ncbi:MAG TPA: glycosyltransferase family 2 protein [Candidatus Saccharimonadales bacterium]|nr:glycosyltransferase family 2 protein [Candidatus Saccharimonadales bacterium]